MNRKDFKSPKGIIAFLMILAGIFLLYSCHGKQPDNMPPPIAEVSVVTIESQQLELTTELPGRTAPFRIAEIRPQVNGLIQKRLYTEGSDVKAGQILYQIDSAPFQAALDNAKAALSRAEATLRATRSRVKRYKDLLADNAVSQQDFDDATAALTQIEADIQYWKATVKTANINLTYASITAPISGRISRSNVTEGAIAIAYQPVALATIQQLDPIYVDVPQSTRELLRLKNSNLNKKGKDQNKVKLILENGMEYPLEGKLQFADVTVDPTTGSVILRIVFPNPHGLLLPGMFVRAILKEGINEKAILLPQQAVSRDPKGNPFALIVDAENKAALRTLTLDRTIDDKWLVTAGLAPGDQVIVEGLKMLRPGMPVKSSAFNNTQSNKHKSLANSGAKHQQQSKGGV